MGEAVAAADEVICERQGAAGRILLNRPKALNALTHAMVRTIHAALDAWADDPAVHVVIVEGVGERAFCAGGDIRALHDLIKAGRAEDALAFWREEYELNIRIKRYPKPYVALVDGIVMGGGGRHVASRKPCRGGRALLLRHAGGGHRLLPDVGATWVLPRLPGHAGRYLALTGQRIGAADAAALGLATKAVSSADIAALRTALAEGRQPADALASIAASAAPAGLGAGELATISRCFAADDAPSILAALDREADAGSAFARATAGTLRSRAPLSLAIALEQMKRGASLSFEDAMRLEFRIVSRMVDHPDFLEGVRAVVIDKDQSPRWSPAALDHVTTDMVERFMAPLRRELVADGRRVLP